MTCFFVGGINRSGTTLLQSILCSDRQTNPLIDEAIYLRKVVEAYVHGKQQFAKHNRFYFDSVDDLRQFTGKWAAGFVEKVRQRYPDTRHVILKHPPLTPHLHALYELLDNTGFFVMIRDPRDVIASMVAVGERLREQNDPEAVLYPRDMTLLAKRYVYCYQPLLQITDAGFGNRLAFIRYEDLVRDTSTVVEHLRQKSGLALEEFDADAEWSDSRMDFNDEINRKSGWTSRLWGKRITAERIGSYRKVLSEAEIATVDDICRQSMEVFGYSR